MKSFQTERKFSYRDLFYKLILFVATVAIIVYFLPKEGHFTSPFEINKPWKYGLLQASFDFPIYKDESQIKKEQDSILANYHPYYIRNKEIGEQMLRKFQNDYNVSLRKILPSVSYYYYIEKQLKDFYKKGIISSTDLSQLHKDSLEYIQEIDQNTSHELAIQSIYTTKQAYENLICSDTLHFQKNLLQQCNLNNYLTPNLIYDAKRSEALRNDLLEDISWANGFVMNGQKIVDRGEIIDKRTFIILNSLID